MAKKITKAFTVTLNKNTEKAGAWIASITIGTEGGDTDLAYLTAWTNASAGKRWIKEQVALQTPRKSVKLTAGETVDEKGKPVSFSGQVTYKVDA